MSRAESRCLSLTNSGQRIRFRLDFCGKDFRIIQINKS